MTQKIKDLFRKAHSKLFRKKTHGTIFGQKFNGSIVLSTHPNVVSKKWRIDFDSNGTIHIFADVVVHGNISCAESVKDYTSSFKESD